MENLEKEIIEEVKEVEVCSSEIIEKEIESITETPKLSDGVLKILDTLGNLNYIELETLKKKMTNEKESVVSANMLLESIENMNTDPMNKKIMSENILDTLEVETFNKDSEKFKLEFATMIAEIDMVIAKIDEECTNRFGEITKTTSFLTSQLVESLDKTLETNKDADPSSLKRLERTKYIYENRTNLDFITRKATLEMSRHNVDKELRKDPTRALKKAVKTLVKFFNKDQLITIEKFIWVQFNENHIATTKFLVHMANIINSEARQLNHNWVVVLFMNIIDIENQLFDMENKDEFVNQIRGLYQFYK